ncbi:uncharacterized protein B0H18DRAFT_958153 [Fomitopsis serialis]|uniref:uncharacterized protein n=1 Tax=Fomitopsis serialis TaxID=139415 RepID=UPI002008B91A|nr:uncharacterized protein B0H18DRAFT_958153 [Neoantrodia serialis]KAH9917957.1 hypothetical protein B0H18DRAFT_958153 [Neoantrodia serialis]
MPPLPIVALCSILAAAHSDGLERHPAASVSAAFPKAASRGWSLEASAGASKLHGSAAKWLAGARGEGAAQRCGGSLGPGRDMGTGLRLYPAEASGASEWLLDNFVSDVLRRPVSSNWFFWLCSRPSVQHSVLESSPLSPLGAMFGDPAAGTACSVPLTHADLREGRPTSSRSLPLSSELRFLRDARVWVLDGAYVQEGGAVQLAGSEAASGTSAWTLVCENASVCSESVLCFGGACLPQYSMVLWPLVGKDGVGKSGMVVENPKPSGARGSTMEQELRARVWAWVSCLSWCRCGGRGRGPALFETCLRKDAFEANFFHIDVFVISCSVSVPWLAAVVRKQYPFHYPTCIGHQHSGNGHQSLRLPLQIDRSRSRSQSHALVMQRMFSIIACRGPLDVHGGAQRHTIPQRIVTRSILRTQLNSLLPRRAVGYSQEFCPSEDRRSHVRPDEAELLKRGALGSMQLSVQHIDVRGRRLSVRSACHKVRSPQIRALAGARGGMCLGGPRVARPLRPVDGQYAQPDLARYLCAWQYPTRIWDLKAVHCAGGAK